MTAHTDVGAYSMGLLEERDRREFEDHLAGCPACAAEVAELSPMAALIRGVELRGAEPGSAAGEAAADGPPEAQVTDFQISANVKTKLASDLGLSTVTNISVNATNGVVTLAGMVTTADQKSKAEGIAKSVPHVVRVVNNLQVSRASTSSRVDWGRLRQPPSQLPPGRRYAI